MMTAIALSTKEEPLSRTEVKAQERLWSMVGDTHWSRNKSSPTTHWDKELHSQQNQPTKPCWHLFKKLTSLMAIQLRFTTFPLLQPNDVEKVHSSLWNEESPFIALHLSCRFLQASQMCGDSGNNGKVNSTCKPVQI